MEFASIISDIKSIQMMRSLSTAPPRMEILLLLLLLEKEDHDASDAAVSVAAPAADDDIGERESHPNFVVNPKAEKMGPFRLQESCPNLL